MENLLQQLNDSQREAVMFCDGPSLIVAGAGSGKTRVLTYKIAYLLKLGLPPYNILALTFTNKAAREMRFRIGELVGENTARRLWMGTFHAVFSRILRSEADKIGFEPTFTIFDTSDSKNLIKAIIKEMQLDDKVYKPGMVHNIISKAKNYLVSPAVYAATKEQIEYDIKAKIPSLKDIYKEYNRRLKAANTMDFDDLLYYTNVLFRDHPDTLKSYQERFQFIMVDEYQDTNRAQYNIIKKLAGSHHRIAVVGDDAQSIYSFRGANIENILNFEKDYPEAKLFKLEQNYRSTQNIVNAANSLISKNRDRIKKNIYSKNEEGEKIEVVSAFSDFEEGIIVANKILDVRREKQQNYSDFVILYRTNAQSRIFEESLRKKNIPYRIYGGLSFYQRKEIKDVIAYFRLVVNPYDEEAFKRIINFPARGIGQTTLNKIIVTAALHNVSLWEIISDNIIAYNLPVNAGTAKKLVDFRNLIESFRQKLTETSAYEMAGIIVKESGIAHEAYLDKTPEGMSRQENLQELLSGIHEFCETRIEEGETDVGLMDFLYGVSLLTDQDTDKEAETEKVTMMTIHAAKGLEFKNVFVVGLEEDLFPSLMAKSELRGLEEERRLFYVALTRAEEFCMLTYAKNRFRNGQTNACNPSRFLKEIAPEYLKSNIGVTGNNIFTSEEKQYDLFWNKVRKDREIREDNEIHKLKPVERKETIISVSMAKQAPATKGDLTVGSVIKHDRFGLGKVLSLTGDAESLKATVEFQNAGTKQLLLKFARFEIIE